MRNRTWTGLAPVVGIFVAGGLVTGCAHRQGQAPVPEVAVSVVQTERVTLTTELPGRISAFLVAEVRPQVNGIIQQRTFTEGSDVKAGALLYQIDPAPYQAALASAQAALAKAQASLPPLQSKMQRDQELVKIDAIGKQELEEDRRPKVGDLLQLASTLGKTVPCQIQRRNIAVPHGEDPSRGAQHVHFHQGARRFS